MNVIETVGLSKAYGRKRAVDGLDLTVRRGEIYGFVGRNGAGKSTAMKMIAGLEPPTVGHDFPIRRSSGAGRHEQTAGRAYREPGHPALSFGPRQRDVPRAFARRGGRRACKL